MRMEGGSGNFWLPLAQTSACWENNMTTGINGLDFFFQTLRFYFVLVYGQLTRSC